MEEKKLTNLASIGKCPKEKLINKYGMGYFVEVSSKYPTKCGDFPACVDCELQHKEYERCF